METTLRNLIRNHHRPGLVHELQTLVFGILQRKLGILIELRIEAGVGVEGGWGEFQTPLCMKPGH